MCYRCPPFPHSAIAVSWPLSRFLAWSGVSLGTHCSHQSDIDRLERVIREYVSAKDYNKVKAIIDQLCNEYAYAVHQPYARNGGLIGLAAAAIALGSVS